MLETIDADKRIDKETYREWFPRLKVDLRELQQKVREARLPVIVLLEGWHMSGKADTIKHLGEALDPRGFNVHTTHSPSEDERERHWLWRFWTRLPPRGKIAFFERSWYTRVLDERVDGRCREEEWNHAYQEILQTEEMLSADGYIILKFWLHITKKEQRRRLRKSEKDPFRRYDVSDADWQIHKKYDEYEAAAEEMLERTSSHQAPWIIVEAGDHRFRRLKIFQTICESVANSINKPAARRQSGERRRISVAALEEMPTLLDKVDLSKRLTQEAYEEKKLVLQVKLRRLQLAAVDRRLTQVVVYEGWDAAGKGGSIRRLTATLDPHHYDVIPISKPTADELARHYLWRFWRTLPRWGQMAIYDRSWYGRVLVERIEGFCTEAEWRRAYQEINEFEMQLYRAGITIIKFWLHISPDEQLRRFEARQADPNKAYKLTEEDWRNREKWQAYREAVDEMITRTSTTYAPWTIIEADCKRHARVRTMETVIAAIEESLHHSSRQPHHRKRTK
jgi:polyphosphate:AMP phosphotransferase